MSDLNIKTEKATLFFALIIDMVIRLMFVTAIIFLTIAIITAIEGQIFVSLFMTFFYLIFILVGGLIRQIRLASFK